MERWVRQMGKGRAIQSHPNPWQEYKRKELPPNDLAFNFLPNSYLTSLLVLPFALKTFNSHPAKSRQRYASPLIHRLTYTPYIKLLLFLPRLFSQFILPIARHFHWNFHCKPLRSSGLTLLYSYPAFHTPYYPRASNKIPRFPPRFCRFINKSNLTKQTAIQIIHNGITHSFNLPSRASCLHLLPPHSSKTVGNISCAVAGSFGITAQQPWKYQNADGET